jgi:hypothetical protein
MYTSNYLSIRLEFQWAFHLDNNDDEFKTFYER